MDLSALSALFKLRPDRAADYLAAKGFKLTGPYWELDGPQHSHVFTVANLAKMDVLQDIRAAAQQALDQGQTERWFADQLVDVLKRKGWWSGKDGSLRRLHTIYATNLQTALMAGRHRQALEQIDRAPWAQYLAIRDHRTRPAHAALHGQVFRLDSPAWSAISPPNGYSCRCRARYLSDRELASRGLKPAEDVRILEREPPGNRPVNPITGDTPARWIQRGVSVPDPAKPGERLTLWADPGWDHIPGSDGAERMLVDKLMAKATQLSDGIRETILARAPQPLSKAAVSRIVANEFVAWWAGSGSENLPLAVLPRADMEAIGAKTPVALLSRESAAKQAREHPELTSEDYARAQDVIDHPTQRVQDSPRSLIYIRVERDGPAGGYVLVVKATATGQGLFVTSYRRLSRDEAIKDAEVARLMRKGKK